MSRVTNVPPTPQYENLARLRNFGFELVQSTRVIGHCSHFIGLGLCYGSFTLTNSATKTDTYTDQMYTEPNGNLHRSVSDQYEHFHTILHKRFLIGLGLGLCQCKHNISVNVASLGYGLGPI